MRGFSVIDRPACAPEVAGIDWRMQEQIGCRAREKKRAKTGEAEDARGRVEGVEGVVVVSRGRRTRELPNYPKNSKK